MDPSLKSQSFFFLQVRDIAAWQLPELAEKQPLPCQAILPALQRGAVWKPQQVEALWDSLVRGFPIGAFLLAPYDASRGNRNFLYQQTSKTTATQGDNNLPHYHLLDGQQRANAIALGFLNLWTSSSPHAQAALWVDLEPPKAQDERAFVFRVVTRSHPWGYRDQNPGQRLEAKHRRAAWEAYRQARAAHANDELTLISQLNLTEVWPWDAKAPVPFPFILQAVASGKADVWQKVHDQLQNLPYWPDNQQLPCFTGEDWKSKVLGLLNKPSDHLERLIAGLQRLLGMGRHAPTLIPAVVLPGEVMHTPALDKPDSPEAAEAEAPPQDPIETLFIRVNAGGVVLSGEELVYSLLKATWPQAQDLVESIKQTFMPPSRMVLLSARLMLARAERESERAPGPLGVERFRRLIHGQDRQAPNFFQDLQNFWESGAARQLFQAAKDLLCDIPDKKGNYGLPPVLAAGISTRSNPEAFYLFLIWLDRLQEAGVDPRTKLDATAKRRLLGALTALSWFAQKPEACLQTLWQKLRKEQELLGFFAPGVLIPCLELTGYRQMQLLPLVPPDILWDTINSAIISADGFKRGKNFWDKWEWWANFAGSFEKKQELRRWYHTTLATWKREEEGQDLLISAWTKLANDLWGKKELVLYAQRHALRNWFPDFDPISPDQLEDTDRPWDFDHIHPKVYVEYKKNIPRLIKDWHSSIGNLRAWPLEANRGDGALAPLKKLNFRRQEPAQQAILAQYGLNGTQQLKEESFVGKEWPDWRQSTPDEEGFPDNYLARDEYQENRCSLIRAITSRWVALYREWYESLCLGELLA